MTELRRVLTLTGLELMLHVHHGHLPSEQRVEASSSSLEALQLEVQVEYRSPGSDVGFDSVYNYSSLVDAVIERQRSTWDKPFEALADYLLNTILASAKHQGISMETVVVRIVRPELAGIHIAIESNWSAQHPERQESDA